MKRILVILITLLIIGALPALAQPEAPDGFVPFTNTTYGIAGIVPDGWQEIAPGTYARASSPTDAAMLAQQSAPVTADQLLAALLPQLRLSEAPEPTGSYTTEAFDWTLYEIEVAVPGMTLTVDLALAEADGVTYLALLQANQDERDALYEAIYQPALDALVPYTGEAEAETMPEPVDLPYIAEDVTFTHGDVTLAGTLTLPDADGPHPAVILITGSGPQDRDESLAPLAEMRPFALIADYLTQAGIAVLRYDDRGTAQSTGDFSTATTADFADDTEAALDYLLSRLEIDSTQIGLLGHSEGGMVAGILAARRPDLAFVISMAGPVADGRALMNTQLARVQQTAGISDEVIANQIELQNALFDALLTGDADAQSQAMYELALAQLLALPEEQVATIPDLEAYAQIVTEQQLPIFVSNWWQFSLAYDPAADWAQISAPVLALLGERDVQVDAEQQIAVYEAIFAQSNHPDYTIVVFPTANHLFQDAVTGGLDEYGTLDQEFLSDVLPTITEWLLERVTLATE